MLGAARRGGTSKAESKAHQQHLVIPAKAGIQGPKRCPSQPAPHPNPLPTSGERGLKAEERDVFDLAFDVAVAVLLTFPPSGCAEHHSPRRTGPRVDAGRGRMPKISPTGHGWPVGETRRGREAQGTLSSRFFFCDERAQTPGRLFWLLLELLPKVTRRRRKTSFRRQEDPARAPAHAALFQR